MSDNFSIVQPVRLEFGRGSIQRLPQLAAFKNALLICGRSALKNGVAAKVEKLMPLCGTFSEVTPNPLLGEAVAAAQLAKELRADGIIALGGGSTLDLAKFAASLVYADKPAEEYFYKRSVFQKDHLQLIAIPTTSGTGTEVTSVSVLTDEKTGYKAPTGHPNFYASATIVDPELTLSLPPKVTADTGIDALAHALEAFWSTKHNAVSDALALKSARLILRSILSAYEHGDIVSRENMALGSLLAGLAFASTKTAGSHACSYPLSTQFHLSHGEACGITLDQFVLINAEVDPRIVDLSADLGTTPDGLAQRICELKGAMGLLRHIPKCSEQDMLNMCEEASVHPLMQTNPIVLSPVQVKKLFDKLSKNY